MISVDAVTGEIYLQLNPKSKTEDVVKYLAELCEDARKEDVEKLFIVLQLFAFKPATNNNIKPIAGLRPATLLVAGLINNCCKKLYRLFEF